MLISRRHPAAAAALAAAAIAALAVGCHRQRDLVDDNELLFDRAQDRITERKFIEAIRILGDIGLVTPISDDLDPKIKLALADAHFYQPGTVNVVEAQSRYEQFLAFYPLNEAASYARYQVGACLLRQAESPENDQEFSVRATRHFEAMIRDLPESDPWRRAAQTQLIKAQESLAEHEWLVASYYLDQERYTGAISRLTLLVDRYPGSARREEALLTLARTLVEVDDLERARTAVERLLADYPEGALADAARTLREEISARLAAGDHGTATVETANGAP